MLIAERCFGMFVVLLLLTPHSLASDPAITCTGTFELRVGQWASYQTDVPFLAEKLELRYAAVGTESVEGSEHYWIEMNGVLGSADSVLQFLVPSYPYATEEIQGIVMKMGEELPAMAYPREAAASMKESDNLSEPLRLACEAVGSAVEETVTVPAGTFDAHRVSVERLGKEVWLSDEVPFGVVKIADPEGRGLELVAYGDDAVSSITEEPQPMFGATP